MGNLITYKTDPSKNIQMSNGLRTVLISVLCLAGRDMADTNEKRDILIWLAQRDQSIFGLGIVGFDITEVCWSIDYFDEQKAFLIKE